MVETGLKRDLDYFYGPIRIKNNRKTEPSDTKKNRMIKTKRKNNSHHKIEQNTKLLLSSLFFQRDEIKIRIKYEVSGVNTKLDRAYSRDNEDKKISKLNTEVQRIVDESQERKERERRSSESVVFNTF